VSFAVANATGLLALVLQDRPVSSPDELVAMLATIRRAAESGTRDRHVPAPSAH
jgi:hypothetical protein